MLECTVSAHRDQNILCHSGSRLWPPSINIILEKNDNILPDLRDGHGLIHVAIECVASFTSEGVEDADRAVAVPRRYVLVVRVETYTEGLL